ncbi:hypothetical protein [Streptomyces hygroscopicus]|uniref:hypothetical protein n=1 Tax=Streptomyces hygroscopicus TaxID=1912 RepID=UPI0036BE0439
MSEQRDAREDLGSVGALAGINWANASAYRRTMQDYDPDTGHDQAWVGTTAHKLFCDRLDRVFSCGKYSVDSPEAAGEGLDVVAAGLGPGEYKRMPRITPGLITRADANGSPGWRYGDWRWLLASFTFGESNSIPWPQKSRTKRRVASQPIPDQLMFPEDDPITMALQAIVQAIAEEEDNAALTTLIVAHSVERELGIRELFLGRSRLNKGGGAAWHWKHDLLAATPGTPGSGPIPVVPEPRTGPPGVPDAAVRLRRQAQEGGSK